MSVSMTVPPAATVSMARRETGDSGRVSFSSQLSSEMRGISQISAARFASVCLADLSSS